MDWARAIERNTEALRGIIAVLFAMLGEVTGERQSHAFHRAVLRGLQSLPYAALLSSRHGDWW